jgi:glycosyltransferase involved in cell wall biosynthesis
MASGLPCIISDHCGSAPDLGSRPPNLVFPCGDSQLLAARLQRLASSTMQSIPENMLVDYSFDHTVRSVCKAYSETPSERREIHSQSGRP